MDDVPVPVPLKPVTFRDQLRVFIRKKDLAFATEKSYISWIVRFIRFHKMKYPENMGATEVEQFLSYLSLTKNTSKSTQRTALNALVFLYDKFLEKPLGQLSFSFTNKSKRLPEVFSQKEINLVLNKLVEPFKLMAEKNQIYTHVMRKGANAVLSPLDV